VTRNLEKFWIFWWNETRPVYFELERKIASVLNSDTTTKKLKLEKPLPKTVSMCFEKGTHIPPMEWGHNSRFRISAGFCKQKK
jgi:hypothetical protein